MPKVKPRNKPQKQTSIKIGVLYEAKWVGVADYSKRSDQRHTVQGQYYHYRRFVICTIARWRDLVGDPMEKLGLWKIEEKKVQDKELELLSVVVLQLIPIS